ncbi:hypothetical protein [Companilactobacillus paralimentarius]|uniref:hypothetical protein n=1 Tax=Companilactobacillus paralimentarius TaxID=83526 RepID=UPI00385100CF
MKNDNVLKKADSLMFWLSYLFPLILFIVPFIKFKFLSSLILFLNKGTIDFSENIDTFSTISTVLIGIFFSLFTILLSIDTNSILIRIDKKVLKKLVTLIFIAFVTSFVFVLFPFVIKIVPNLQLGCKRFFMSLFLFLILLTLRTGLYFFLIIKFDLNNKVDKIKSDEKKREEEQKMIKKLYDKFFS